MSHTNTLINETSPYLLQHARNPVDWYAWSDEAWEKARAENKLVLVSVGYSACHWCHVMERESFEDAATAKLMNENYICIKVDREERPDVDQVYMNAVQLMTGRGGWPLNCFTLPDGRPIYGGTYFPNEAWKEILVKLNSFYRNNPDTAKQYAEELTQGIKQSEPFKIKSTEPEFSAEVLTPLLDNWKKSFDATEGGPNRAPKFPMPNNYEFLLRCHYATHDESALSHVLLTLNKMAYGGIYDHLGGGFARYSTDTLWKVPHFEKMLYDNAQLVTLYSYAYQFKPSELYRNVVYETLGFIAREMTSGTGGFYAALDADSEGEEGKYYVWKEEELEKILGESAPLFFEYFNVNKTGYWEHGNYILLRKKTDGEIAKQFNITIEDVQRVIFKSKEILLKEREKRVKPGLDDKIITSWNALMIKAYCNAYDVFNEKKFLDAAVKAAGFILSNCSQKDGGIVHHTHPKMSGEKRAKENPGFLDDYSFLCQALVALYQSSLEERWLNEAKRLADYAVKNFFDEEQGMFYYTSALSPQLIARQKEIMDNVIPSSNSSMARALFELSLYFEEKNFRKISQRMLNNVVDDMEKHGPYYSNWGILLLNEVFPFYEVAIAGKSAGQLMTELNQHYIPNKVVAAAESASSVLLLKDRFAGSNTMIYICQNNVCKQPLERVSDALNQLK